MRLAANRSLMRFSMYASMYVSSSTTESIRVFCFSKSKMAWRLKGQPLGLTALGNGTPTTKRQRRGDELTNPSPLRPGTARDTPVRGWFMLLLDVILYRPGARTRGRRALERTPHCYTHAILPRAGVRYRTSHTLPAVPILLWLMSNFVRLRCDFATYTKCNNAWYPPYHPKSTRNLMAAHASQAPIPRGKWRCLTGQEHTKFLYRLEIQGIAA